MTRFPFFPALITPETYPISPAWMPGLVLDIPTTSSRAEPGFGSIIAPLSQLLMPEDRVLQLLRVRVSFPTASRLTITCFHESCAIQLVTRKKYHSHFQCDREPPLLTQPLLQVCLLGAGLDLYGARVGVHAKPATALGVRGSIRGGWV